MATIRNTFAPRVKQGLVCAAVLGLMMAMPMAAMADKDDEATTLNVSVQVDVKAAPDIAYISSGVVTVAKTAQEAMTQNAEKMNAVFAALKKQGIADKDRQTSGLQVSPQYVYEQNKSPEITGYQARNEVSVTIRDLKKVGPVIDALVAQGANQLSGPTFGVEDSEDLLHAARKEAVTKARKRAEIYAAAAGMKVKRLQSITENSHGGAVPYQPVMARAMMMKDRAESTPIASGEVSLNVSANVVYVLE